MRRCGLVDGSRGPDRRVLDGNAVHRVHNARLARSPSFVRINGWTVRRGVQPPRSAATAAALRCLRSAHARRLPPASRHRTSPCAAPPLLLTSFYGHKGRRSCEQALWTLWTASSSSSRRCASGNIGARIDREHGCPADREHRCPGYAQNGTKRFNVRSTMPRSVSTKVSSKRPSGCSVTPRCM